MKLVSLPIIFLLFLVLSCKQSEVSKPIHMSEDTAKYTNSLINETSPYLLQHAHNPVEWYAWGEEALQKATQENKPIILSIGYSSCHWCHVMEHQSFEDTAIAEVMNTHFINIKVDREERPDIDRIYMDAVQSMGLGGGWPLNVFLLPNKKPFYGGTYFPPEKWKALLLQVAKVYKEQPDKLEETAEDITRSLNISDTKKYNLSGEVLNLSEEKIHGMFESLSSRFDKRRGGLDRAPKFPMPSVYEFLLGYGFYTDKLEAREHTLFTLKAMGNGGLYDQIGGGFARYSTDAEWFAPHFEKMLYDNGQLLSLLGHAFALSKDPYYKEKAMETIEWLEREMTSEMGGFYSALDADSEGEEGLFYTWTEQEIDNILPEKEVPLFQAYYNTKPRGNWEGRNILYVEDDAGILAEKFNYSETEIKKMISGWKKKLLEAREKRIRPGLDDKIILSWNAITLDGLIAVYKVTKESGVLELALQNVNFLMDQMKDKETGEYYHTYKEGKASLHAFLDDYSLFIKALISLYEVTFDIKYLDEATRLVELADKEFFDESEGFYFFSHSSHDDLIARKKDLFDDVIPSSNSVMAENLYKLGIIYQNEEWSNKSRLMLARVQPILEKEPYFMSNWARLFTNMLHNTAEVSIIGSDHAAFRNDMQLYFHPNVIYTGSQSEQNLPILKNRDAINNQTTIFVCFEGACQLPVHTVKEAIGQLEK